MFLSQVTSDQKLHVWAVFDGHGEHGHHVSKLCRERLVNIWLEQDMNLPRAFRCMQTELDKSPVDVKCSGATAVMIVMRGTQLEVCATPTTDHSPSTHPPSTSISFHILSFLPFPVHHSPCCSASPSPSSYGGPELHLLTSENSRCSRTRPSLQVANCGDSRSVLGRMHNGKVLAVLLTHDHKPDRPDEKRRVIQVHMPTF